jgi:hypothetical protein
MKLSTNLDLIWNVSSFFFFYAWCAIYNCIIHVCHLSLCVFLSFWDVIFYTCIINVCQIYLSSFQENIKIYCFILNVKLCMMCYLQLHNTRLSSIFMCFSFFFVFGKFGKQIFRSLNSLFRNKQNKLRSILNPDLLIISFLKIKYTYVSILFIYLFYFILFYFILFITHLS